jgi:transposase
MPVFKHVVDLTSDEKKHIFHLLRSGGVSRKSVRARILLMADAGFVDREVADLLKLSRSTVVGLRRRFVKEGLVATLNDRPRTGRASKLNQRQTALLIAVARGQAPEGRPRWTLRLLPQRMVQLGFTTSICHETVRAILRKALWEEPAKGLVARPRGVWS